MKNMIDRYLYDVSKRLPESIRLDVERELRSNIADMLPENPADEEIEKVLLSLGSPAKLAVRYHPNPRYLIPPELFDDYLMFLKIVAASLAGLLAALSVFRVIFGDAGGAGIVETTVSVVTSLITAAFTGAVHAFLWVTVGFSCVAYFGKDKIGAQWSPKNLPDIPKNTKAVIKRSDTIAGPSFPSCFPSCFWSERCAGLRSSPGMRAGVPAVPLFSEHVVRQFLPLFVIAILFLLFISVLKLVSGRWTVTVAVAQCVYSIFNTVVGIAFLTRPDVFTEAFVARFADKLYVTMRCCQVIFIPA
jgi:hypothetical protein